MSSNNSDYLSDSIVNTHNDRIESLVDAHWSYIEKVITTGADEDQVYDFDQMMEIVKLHYKTSGVHFYKHGYEDGVETLNELSLAFGPKHSDF